MNNFRFYWNFSDWPTIDPQSMTTAGLIDFFFFLFWPFGRILQGFWIKLFRKWWNFHWAQFILGGMRCSQAFTQAYDVWHVSFSTDSRKILRLSVPFPNWSMIESPDRVNSRPDNNNNNQHVLIFYFQIQPSKWIQYFTRQPMGYHRRYHRKVNWQHTWWAISNGDILGHTTITLTSSLFSPIQSNMHFANSF